MSDRADPLLAAVLADPDSDAARLALAHALRARGELQGELMELQINAMQELRAYGATAAYRAMSVRARELTAQHAAAWTSVVRDIAMHPILLRGLVEGVTLDARRFLSVAHELYKRAPIRQLVLVDAGDLAPDIANSAHLDQIVSLIFFNKSKTSGIGDVGVKAIAESPHVAKLKRLEVAWNDVGMEGLEALAASRQLPNLVYAHLGGNKLDPVVEVHSSIDGASGLVMDETFELTPLGIQLEAKHGRLAWLHRGPFLNYPPGDEEL